MTSARTCHLLWTRFRTRVGRDRDDVRKNEQGETPGHLYARHRACTRFIFDWFHFMRASRRAACFVYVLGETGSLPRIPMAVLMERTDVSFTNQQRSGATREHGIIGDPRTLPPITDRDPPSFLATLDARPTNGPSRKASANIRRIGANVRYIANDFYVYSLLG